VTNVEQMSVLDLQYTDTPEVAVRGAAIKQIPQPYISDDSMYSTDWDRWGTPVEPGEIEH
jgi:hypothetical protein